ncbi:hypothetical protein SAMN05446589_9291 [Streptomyces sp. OV198]|nr:hypothetical protein SAMN05446589_9291 [Streptomyces sp. OV198]
MAVDACHLVRPCRVPMERDPDHLNSERYPVRQRHGTESSAPSVEGPYDVPETDHDRIRHEALPLSGPASLDPLLERIGDARYLLLGEASHGTGEYY